MVALARLHSGSRLLRRIIERGDGRPRLSPDHCPTWCLRLLTLAKSCRQSYLACVCLHAAAGGHLSGKRKGIPPQVVALAFACAQLCSDVDSTAVPRLTQAPKLEDFEGMRSNAIAAKMGSVSEFIQNFPSDGR